MYKEDLLPCLTPVAVAKFHSTIYKFYQQLALSLCSTHTHTWARVRLFRDILKKRL